jgi:dienelactone hydrolase
MKKLLPLLALTFLLPSHAYAQSTNAVEYMDNETQLESQWVEAQCANTLAAASAPLILVIPQWKGISAHEISVAEDLGAKCNNVLVVEMYGKGIRPQNTEEAAAQSSKYKNDPALALSRMNAALDFAKTKTDTTNISVLGYCFGGTMALNLARSGADITRVVSFHGGLDTSITQDQRGDITASILVHHGDADPLIKPETVEEFLTEMRDHAPDWQFIRYANAVHAFTEPGAGNDPSTGVAYNEKADKRSWATTLDFLEDATVE